MASFLPPLSFTFTSSSGLAFTVGLSPVFFQFLFLSAALTLRMLSALFPLPGLLLLHSLP